MKYACNQCEYLATHPSHLKAHIQAIHEGVKYACNQCEYKATHQSHLKIHIQSKHEGVKYACEQCEQSALKQSKPELNQEHLEDHQSQIMIFGLQNKSQGHMAHQEVAVG